MKKRLVFEYDSEREQPVGWMQFELVGEDRLDLRAGRIEDAAPEKPEPLLPCPFSGHKGLVHQRSDGTIECAGCRATAPNRAAWNRRES